MPKNRGATPPFEFVDIQFRNGQMRRGVKSEQWRWRSWGWESDWDIVRWQRSFVKN